MKKLLSITVVLAMTVGVLSACSFNTNVKTDTIFIGNGGNITEATIETFDKNYYNTGELKKFVEKEVNAYKAKDGTGTVKVQRMNVKKGIAKLYMGYSSYKTYAIFNDVTFFAGNVIQAQAEGYNFDTAFYTAEQAKEAIDSSTEQTLTTADSKTKTAIKKPKSTEKVTTETEKSTASTGETESLHEDSTAGTETLKSTEAAKKAKTEDKKKNNTKASVSKEKILSKDSYKVVVLQENTDVVIKGKILYVSSHVKVTGDNTATVTDEGADSTNVTPAYIIYQ